MSIETAREEIQSLLESGYVMTTVLAEEIYGKHEVAKSASRRDFKRITETQELEIPIGVTQIEGTKVQAFYHPHLGPEGGETDLGRDTDIELVRRDIRRLLHLEAPSHHVLEELKRVHTWEEQIQNLIKHNFHTSLGLTEEAYRASLPPFHSQPEEFKDRFDIPLLVDPRIDIGTQLKLLGMTRDTYAQFNEKTSSDPYQIWVQNGMAHVKISPKRFNSIHKQDEIGLNIVEGLTLVREYPNVIQSHNIILAASSSQEYNKTAIIGRQYTTLHLDTKPSWSKPRFGGIASRGISNI